MMNKQYKSEIEKDSINPNIVRQIFTATRINITEEDEGVYIQFAEDIDNITIHSLLFCIPKQDSNSEEDLYVEFNDQSNGMFGKQVGKVELNNKYLVLFPSEIVLYAARVSYSSDADIFEESPFLEIQINQILVKHNSDSETLETLNSFFQHLPIYGVDYHFGL